MDLIAQNRIEKAIPNSEAFTVTLRWVNGSETVAHFDHLVGHGVFGPLHDPKFFKQVSLRRGGRVLTWPGDLDIGADSLWFQAHPEDIPEAMKPYYPPIARYAAEGPKP